MPSLPELMPTEVSDETFGGVTYHIAGELVPVLSVDVTRMPVYFEHHILLWKNSTITIGLKSLKGALKRMMAGMQIFVTEASGAGISIGEFSHAGTKPASPRSAPRNVPVLRRRVAHLADLVVVRLDFGILPFDYPLDVAR